MPSFDTTARRRTIVNLDEEVRRRIKELAKSADYQDYQLRLFKELSASQERQRSPRPHSKSRERRAVYKSGPVTHYQLQTLIRELSEPYVDADDKLLGELLAVTSCMVAGRLCSGHPVVDAKLFAAASAGANLLAIERDRQRVPQLRRLQEILRAPHRIDAAFRLVAATLQRPRGQHEQALVAALERMSTALAEAHHAGEALAPLLDQAINRGEIDRATLPANKTPPQRGGRPAHVALGQVVYQLRVVWLSSISPDAVQAFSRKEIAKLVVDGWGPEDRGRRLARAEKQFVRWARSTDQAILPWSGQRFVRRSG